MIHLGEGRYICPDKHGEWLVDEKEMGIEVDPDPFRHEKTLASQIRESGSGNNGVGRAKDRKQFYRRPWETT